MGKQVEKIPGEELSRRYPHVKGKYYYAATRGTINRSQIPGDRHYRYHLDDDFERWQARYLPRKSEADGQAEGQAEGQAATASLQGGLPPCFDELTSAYRATQQVHAAGILQLYEGGDPDEIKRTLLESFSTLVYAHQEVGFLIDNLMQAAGLDGLLDVKPATTDRSRSAAEAISYASRINGGGEDPS